MMYQPQIEAKVNTQISSYAYFFSLASLSMNSIKDGASFVFLQCWSQLLNQKNNPQRVCWNSVFWSTSEKLGSILKSSARLLSFHPFLRDFDVLSFYLPLAITVTDGAMLVLYPELFLHLPLRRVIEVHTSPLLSAALELEAQPFQVNIYQSQQNKEWVLACKLQLSEVFEKLCKITRSIPPLPFYFSCLYTHCQKNETPSYSSSWVYSWCLKAENRCATCLQLSCALAERVGWHLGLSSAFISCESHQLHWSFWKIFDWYYLTSPEPSHPLSKFLPDCVSVFCSPQPSLPPTGRVATCWNCYV